MGRWDRACFVAGLLAVALPASPALAGLADEEAGKAAAPEAVSSSSASGDQYYKSGPWAYYNALVPLVFAGAGFYDITAVYTIPSGRKSEGRFSTRMWMVGLHSDRLGYDGDAYDSPDGTDFEFTETGVGVFVGYRHYFLSDELKGFGAAAFTVIGYWWDDQGENGGYESESGDYESLVLDVFYTFRFGALWVEPSFLGGFDKRGDFAPVFIPGIRVGFAL